MTNILSDTEARRALGIGPTDGTKTDLMQAANLAVTRVLEDRCGPVVYGTVTAEAHDGGGNRFYLRSYPVVSIVSLVEYDNTTASTLTAESNTSKPTAAYYLNTVNGGVTRRESNGDARFPSGRGNVVCTYVAGRYATQGSIAGAWKEAAAVTLVNAWQVYQDSVQQTGEFEYPQARFPTFGVPKHARELLASEWHSGSGTGE